MIYPTVKGRIYIFNEFSFCFFFVVDIFFFTTPVLATILQYYTTACRQSSIHFFAAGLCVVWLISMNTAGNIYSMLLRCYEYTLIRYMKIERCVPTCTVCSLELFHPQELNLGKSNCNV